MWGSLLANVRELTNTQQILSVKKCKPIYHQAEDVSLLVVNKYELLLGDILLVYQQVANMNQITSRQQMSQFTDNQATFASLIVVSKYQVLYQKKLKLLAGLLVHGESAPVYQYIANEFVYLCWCRTNLWLVIFF